MQGNTPGASEEQLGSSDSRDPKYEKLATEVQWPKQISFKQGRKDAALSGYCVNHPSPAKTPHSESEPAGLSPDFPSPSSSSTKLHT